MSHPSEPIYKSIMGGEIVALQQAIEKIWKAHLIAIMNGGGAWKRHVEPAIYEAVKLLPPEMRLRSGPNEFEDQKSLSNCEPKFGETRPFQGFPGKSSFEDLF